MLQNGLVSGLAWAFGVGLGGSWALGSYCSNCFFKPWSVGDCGAPHLGLPLQTGILDTPWGIRVCSGACEWQLSAVLGAQLSPKGQSVLAVFPRCCLSVLQAKGEGGDWNLLHTSILSMPPALAGRTAVPWAGGERAAGLS